MKPSTSRARDRRMLQFRNERDKAMLRCAKLRKALEKILALPVKTFDHRDIAEEALKADGTIDGEPFEAVGAPEDE